MATAAHQVEGQSRNSDWWHSETRGLVPHRSGDACDSWNRYREDIELLRWLGVNAYRLSVEWARIEPEPGRFDQSALDHYRRLLETLRVAGIEPIVTLHHFTNPIWLTRAGAWANPQVVPRFAAYAERVGRELGDLVDWWVSVNEPNIAGQFGYLAGAWPPHRRRHLPGYFRHLAHAARGHTLARQSLASTRSGARVGLAFALWPFDPASARSPFDRGLARLADYSFQGWLLARTARDLDWVGVNYYSRKLVSAVPPRFADRKVPGRNTDFGWEIYPEGLYRVLTRVQRLGKPVLITENGIADAADDQRPRYLVEHLLQAHRAIQAGVDLRGYFHWSLLDNFEWSEGYTKRFGLVAVDFETQARQPRRSAALYREIIAAGGLPVELLERFSSN